MAGKVVGIELNENDSGAWEMVLIVYTPGCRKEIYEYVAVLSRDAAIVDLLEEIKHIEHS